MKPFIGAPCHSLHLRVHLVGIAEVFLCSSSLVVSLCLRNLAWKKERMGIGKVSQEVSLEVVSSLKTDSLQLKIGQGPKGNFIIQRFLRGEMLVLGRVTYLFAYYERSMIHHASYFNRFLDRLFRAAKKKLGFCFFSCTSLYSWLGCVGASFASEGDFFFRALHPWSSTGFKHGSAVRICPCKMKIPNLATNQNHFQVPFLKLWGVLPLS